MENYVRPASNNISIYLLGDVQLRCANIHRVGEDAMST